MKRISFTTSQSEIKMRVVLDTNIFVSGIHWSGASEEILSIWISGKFKLISSQSMIDELMRILRSFKIPLELKDILHWRKLILEKGIIFKPERSLDVVKNDPSDNKFIEAALEGRADYIVSQDKHLLKIGEYENIKIVNPKEFLELLEKELRGK